MLQKECSTLGLLGSCLFAVFGMELRVCLLMGCRLAAANVSDIRHRICHFSVPCFHLHLELGYIFVGAVRVVLLVVVNL